MRFRGSESGSEMLDSESNTLEWGSKRLRRLNYCKSLWGSRGILVRASKTCRLAEGTGAAFIGRAGNWNKKHTR